MKSEEYKFKEFGITLISFVITIIILIILAGVAINLSIGENGIFTKAKNASEKYKIAQIRETVELGILDVEMKEVNLGNEVTVEQALIEIEEKGIFEEIDLKEQTGICEGYIIKLGYNENGKVIIDGIEKDEGERITVKTEPLGFTNGNVEIEIGVSPNQINITNIEVPNEITQKENGKYEVTKNGIYLIKVTLENGVTLEKEIKIEQIDKLPPKSFEITTENTENGFIIMGDTIDEEATEDSACSGIDRYEYIIVDQAGNETIYNNKEIKNLADGKYTLYAIAYDKAGNPSQKNNGITVRQNYYEWSKYNKAPVYSYKLYKVGTDWGKPSKYMAGIRSLSKNFDSTTGKWKNAYKITGYPSVGDIYIKFGCIDSQIPNVESSSAYKITAYNGSDKYLGWSVKTDTYTSYLDHYTKGSKDYRNSYKHVTRYLSRQW